MHTAQTMTAALECQLSNLTVCSHDFPGANLDGCNPFQISVEVNFRDTVNQEFAQILVAAGLTLRTTFHAKFADSNRVLELGSMVLETTPGVLSYTPMLEIEHPSALGLLGDKPYQMGAMVRVGTSSFCIPSLMRGTIEGGVLKAAETKILVENTSSETSEEPEMAIASAKTPRRRTVKK